MVHDESSKVLIYGKYSAIGGPCPAPVFKDLETIPDTRCREATLEGHTKGTMMNVHNLVSYLVGWNRLVLKWIDLDAKGVVINT